jgi:hypothetical protein
LKLSQQQIITVLAVELAHAAADREQLAFELDQARQEIERLKPQGPMDDNNVKIGEGR